MRQHEILVGFKDYLRYERMYSSHTLEAYSRDIDQFSLYLHSQYGMEDLAMATHSIVRSWVVALLKDKNQTVTIRRKISALAHLYKWMRRRGMMQHNPLLKVHLPKIPERLPKALPESVLQRLWSSLGEGVSEGSYGSLRDQVMIALLYGSGLRRSELIHLTWGDIDATRKMIRIFGKGRKIRQVPVGPEVLNLLEMLKMALPDGWEALATARVVLTDNGKPCYPKFVYNRVVDMVGRYTTADKKSPHILRHSMATHLMDHGAELNAVKEILGHASLAATQVYTHNSISRLRDVYRQAHPSGGLKGGVAKPLGEV